MAPLRHTIESVNLKTYAKYSWVVFFLHPDFIF